MEIKKFKDKVEELKEIEKMAPLIMKKRTINNQALEKQIQLFKEKYGSKCLDFLTPNLKTEIIRVIKNGKPVIISNDYGRTGKTTLKLFIRSLGGIAYEEWECKKITLKKPL